MSKIPKFSGILAFSTAIIAILFLSTINGKKEEAWQLIKSNLIMDYSDTLVQQSSITLGPSAFGELDFFNRRLHDSLYDLYQVGQDEAIDPSHLDLDELEQFINSRH